MSVSCLLAMHFLVMQKAFPDYRSIFLQKPCIRGGVWAECPGQEARLADHAWGLHVPGNGELTTAYRGAFPGLSFDSPFPSITDR